VVFLRAVEVKRRTKRFEAEQAMKPELAVPPEPAKGPEPTRLARLLLRTLLSPRHGAPPTTAEVAGVYRATLFTSQEGGLTSNRLTHGSRLDLVLDPDGTSTGLLWVTGDAAGGRGYNVPLTGKWRLRGDTVELDLTKDVFVSDMPFVYHDGTLEAEQSFGATVTRVVLTKMAG
jgi:hypothetical protein